MKNIIDEIYNRIERNIEWLEKENIFIDYKKLQKKSALNRYIIWNSTFKYVKKYKDSIVITLLSPNKSKYFSRKDLQFYNKVYQKKSTTITIYNNSIKYNNKFLTLYQVITKFINICQFTFLKKSDIYKIYNIDEGNILSNSLGSNILLMNDVKNKSLEQVNKSLNYNDSTIPVEYKKILYLFENRLLVDKKDIVKSIISNSTDLGKKGISYPLIGLEKLLIGKYLIPFIPIKNRFFTVTNSNIINYCNYTNNEFCKYFKILDDNENVKLGIELFKAKNSQLWE